MRQVLRRVAATISPVRARAKVLARENREMRARLVEIRRNAGLTQADVAHRMNVTQQAVNKLERYDADPRLSTLERYANAVGALVSHRVHADHGQSIAMARSSWQADAATTRRRVSSTSQARSRAIDGWSTVPHVLPAEMSAS